MVGMMYTVCNEHPLVRVSMLFVDTSIIHHSSEGVLILCNILDLLIYSLNLKSYRRIATRYDKLACTYLAILCMATTVIWLK